ncbi:MAG TPA: hypothetical protein VD699_01640 [Nitrosopumilaceae archaeon]|nr:hypothetical protein [Nitrosopumilaceae archaeon]
MNFKGIFVVGIIVAIIVVVVLVPNNTRNTPPALDDKPAMNDSVLINSKLQNSDEIKLKDYTIAEKPSDLDYYLDENGSKHYIIKAEDDVNISE